MWDNFDWAGGLRKDRDDITGREIEKRTNWEACLQIGEERRKAIVNLLNPDFMKLGYDFQMIHSAHIVEKPLPDKVKDNKSWNRWNPDAGQLRAMGLDTRLTCRHREGYLDNMIRWTKGRNVYAKKPNDLSIESFIQRMDFMCVTIFTTNRKRYYAEMIRTLRKMLGLGWKHDDSEKNESRWYLAYGNGNGSPLDPKTDLGIQNWPHALENHPSNKTPEFFKPPKLGYASRMIQLYNEENSWKGKGE